MPMRAAASEQPVNTVQHLSHTLRDLHRPFDASHTPARPSDPRLLQRSISASHISAYANPASSHPAAPIATIDALDFPSIALDAVEPSWPAQDVFEDAPAFDAGPPPVPRVRSPRSRSNDYPNQRRRLRNTRDRTPSRDDPAASARDESPAYWPANPTYSPDSPAYSPTSPLYAPDDSPTPYSPTSPWFGSSPSTYYPSPEPSSPQPGIFFAPHRQNLAQSRLDHLSAQYHTFREISNPGSDALMHRAHGWRPGYPFAQSPLARVAPDDTNSAHEQQVQQNPALYLNYIQSNAPHLGQMHENYVRLRAQVEAMMGRGQPPPPPPPPAAPPARGLAEAPAAPLPQPEVQPPLRDTLALDEVITPILDGLPMYRRLLNRRRTDPGGERIYSPTVTVMR